MKVLSFAALAASLCAAAPALANPYGMPATLPAPSRVYQTGGHEIAPQPVYTEAEGEVIDAPQYAAPMPEPAGDCGCDDGAYAGNGYAYDEALSYGGYGAAACCNPWYVSVAGLHMTRDRGNKVFTTFDTTNINNQLMHTWDADSEWGCGVEVTVGRRFGCGCEHAWEITYWTIEELEGSASISSTSNTLGTTFNLPFVTYDGVQAEDYFTGAAEHRISRRDEFENLELNLLKLPVGDCCSRFQGSALVGVRYFRFDEQLQFASVRGGSEFGANGGADEVYLDVDVENNLLGVQIGGRGDLRVSQKLNLYAAPEVGVYLNHMKSSADSYRGDGVHGVVDPSAAGPGGVSGTFPFSSNEDDFAILCQLDVGAEYNITERLSIFGGYRAVAISGVALSDEQIPRFLADVPEWEDIDNNGHLILHGAYAGLEFRF